MAITVSDVGQNHVLTWSGITGATSGDAYRLEGDRALAGAAQVISGTVGSVSIEVSNDGTNWAALADVNGTTIALTAVTQVAEFSTAALYIRPTGNGTSSAAVVKMVLRG